MNIYLLIKNERASQGISQQRLAELAQVSIPTLQNLEANKANVSFDILSRILTALNLKIEVSPAEFDWDSLVEYGLPLVSLKKYKKSNSLNKNKLQQLLVIACNDLCKNNKQKDYSRKKEALGAYLFAIKNHYACFYDKIKKSTQVQKFTPDLKSISDRHIKLYRYSKEFLGGIL